MAPGLVDSAVCPTGGGPRPVGTVVCLAQGIPVEGGVKQPGLRQELCPALGPVLQVPRPCPDAPEVSSKSPPIDRPPASASQGTLSREHPGEVRLSLVSPFCRPPVSPQGPGWCPVAPKAHGAERLRWRRPWPFIRAGHPHSAHWLRGDLRPHHPVRPWAREPGARAAGGSPSAAGLGRGPCSHRAPGGRQGWGPGSGPSWMVGGEGCWLRGWAAAGTAACRRAP